MSRAASEMDRWKAALLTLPDDSFFAIVRNYFGELRTPFNKHTLIEELVAFAGKGETVERMLAMIDEQDARLLSAIEVLREPDLDRLFAFFGGGLSYLELHHLILNFEERLLIYRDRSRGPARLVFTPILKERIVTRIVDRNLLFPSFPVGPAAAPAPWLTDHVLIALFAYLLAAKGAIRNDGTLKKRSQEELAALIPPLAPAGRTEGALRALRRLSLLKVDEGVLIPAVDRWRSLAELDPRSRIATVWSAAMDDSPAARQADSRRHGDSGEGTRAAAGEGAEVSEDARKPTEASIYRRAVVVAGVMATMAADRGYPAASLEKIAVASDIETRPLGPHLQSTAAIIDGMEKLGLLVPVPGTPPATNGAAGSDESLYRRGDTPLSPLAREERNTFVEPNFLVTVTPTIDFARAIDIALTCELRRYDVYSQYEITKESFMRALEHGLSASAVEDLFVSLSGAALAQNIRFTLGSWQREIEGISLSSGVVLTADAERRHLIEHSEAMRPYLRRILAPGVYLLDPGERKEWEEALRRAGIAPLPSVRAVAKPHDAVRTQPFRAISGAPSLGLSGPHDHRKSDGTDIPRQEATSHKLRDALLKELDALSLPEDQRGEIAARINKKLILYPTQLAGLVGRIERSEAKGLDYVGKIRLIEQALASETELLEILDRRPKGESHRVLVKPVRLEHVGNDLLLSALTLPDEAQIQIKVRKMGLVRKLRGSLFAP